MTNEEAIKVLHEINYDTIQENVVQATNMAISALEQLPLSEVLGEIKGEIEQVKAVMNEEIIEHNRKDLINFVNGVNQCLCIIDSHISGKDMP